MTDAAAVPPEPAPTPATGPSDAPVAAPSDALVAGPSGDGSPASGSAPVPAGAPRAPVLPEVLTALAIVLGSAVAGVAVGLLWAAVAPSVRVVPDGASLDLDTETKAFIGADGLLFVLGLVAGIVATAACWRLARRRPLGAVLGLVLGGLAGAVVAWRTGVLVGTHGDLLAAARAGRQTGPFLLPLTLHAKIVLLGWPAGAAVTAAALLLSAEQTGAARAPAEPAPADGAGDPSGSAPGADPDPAPRRPGVSWG